jgi:hypothetical protein
MFRFLRDVLHPVEPEDEARLRQAGVVPGPLGATPEELPGDGGVLRPAQKRFRERQVEGGAPAGGGRARQFGLFAAAKERLKMEKKD